MDLRTGKPVWLQRAPRALRGSKLRGEVTCDVAIVGAGITGALVARALTKAGLRVVALDQRAAGRGSTAASTGLLMYRTDSTIAALTRAHGHTAARRVFELGRLAIRDLRRIAEEIAASGGVQPRRTLYLGSAPRDRATLKLACRQTHALGFPATLLTPQQLRRRFALPHSTGLLEPGAAQMDALRFTLAVWRACTRTASCRLYQHTTVTRLRETRAGVVIHTRGGGRVQAARVIVAAGYEAARFVPSRLVQLHSTYVIASPPFRPEQLVPLRCLMWETARPYFYLRTTTDHRIVFGGADEPFSRPARRDRLLPRKTRALQAQFAALFPALAFTPAFAWTGTFGDSVDGLPCIGATRRGGRILCALGYGGNGITFSQVAARILADLCLGRENSDAALFRLDRSVRAPRRRQRRDRRRRVRRHRA